MNRSTDQALRSLLPTHNGALPPALADLAGSLLAQSRHRVRTLKADEEGARPYACAHIACDRLKTSLNLPPIEPRPPIQPRLYKRLYAHLTAVLQPRPAEPTGPDAQSGLGSTPRKAAPAPLTPRAAATTPRATPKPTPKPAPSAHPAPSSSLSSPFWLRPTVRFVCRELGHPQLAPTMAAGLSAIRREAALAPRPRDEQGEKQEGAENDDDDDDEDMAAWVESSLTALTAALYLYCLTAWREEEAASAGGGAPAKAVGHEERQFQADEKAILGVFARVRAADALEAALETAALEAGAADPWAGWEDLRKRTFRDALVVVSERGWLQSDWYRDIAALYQQHQRRRRRQQGQAGDSDSGSEGEGEAEGDDDDDGHGHGYSHDGGLPTKAWRADSMFQARYDFLSEAKQREYETWRAHMLAALGGGGAPASEPMEVDGSQD